jgi:hypothetical protein
MGRVTNIKPKLFIFFFFFFFNAEQNRVLELGRAFTVFHRVTKHSLIQRN